MPFLFKSLFCIRFHNSFSSASTAIHNEFKTFLMLKGIPRWKEGAAGYQAFDETGQPCNLKTMATLYELFSSAKEIFQYD